jgi:ergothioneine biosynthesis protein EgtB
MSISGISAIDRGELLKHFRRVRQASIEMCCSLQPGDYRIQPIDDVSPPWWNLGHTSWFFARNVLAVFGGEVVPEDSAYDYTLNSYYASLGQRLPRSRRGSISRPTTEEIYRYRQSVDRRVEALIETVEERRFANLEFVVRIGIQHEQQHQELFYTEIKCILAGNPPDLRQPYRTNGDITPVCEAASGPFRQMGDVPVSPARFVALDGGLFEFGHREEGWCWDNELPVHEFFLHPFSLQDRLVTNAEYQEFLADGGYRQQLLWLDNGWARVQQEAWQSPLYWEQRDGEWSIWTLAGLRPLAADEPVCHVSFYEADAFARWASQTFARCKRARLPSEREWEHAARQLQSQASADAFLESNRLHPSPVQGKNGDIAHLCEAPVGPFRQMGNVPVLSQMAGVLWQWTTSYYEPYPGYEPFPGVLAEYNGKFMDNQRVLRGGSCVTPRDHYRVSYRNFWPAPTRFQFTGIRLALDAER